MDRDRLVDVVWPALAGLAVYVPVVLWRGDDVGFQLGVGVLMAVTVAVARWFRSGKRTNDD